MKNFFVSATAVIAYSAEFSLEPPYHNFLNPVSVTALSGAWKCNLSQRA